MKKYKWSIFLALLIACSILLPACATTKNKDSKFPYLEYIDSGYTFDEQNQLINLPDGYILNQGYSYDIVETDVGCDVIVHLIKEDI